jgi:hypothetical protein
MDMTASLQTTPQQTSLVVHANGKMWWTSGRLKTQGLFEMGISRSQSTSAFRSGQKRFAGVQEKIHRAGWKERNLGRY